MQKIKGAIRSSLHSIALLFMVAMMISCGGEKKVKILKLAHGLDRSHSVHKAMVYMGERIKEKSGGKMAIEIYPSGQLGGESQCLELLQIGSLAITKVSAATMEGFSPKYQVLGLPYMFRSRENAFGILDGEIGDELLDDLDRAWLKGLCFYDSGCRSFYSKEKHIESPDDLKGLKIRVMKSNTAVNMIKNMGGSPTPISWGELYTALQSGVVDGAENNPPSFHLSRHYEVCKYYSIDEHTMIPDVLVMSSFVWDTLSEEEQGWVREAARESVPVQRKLWMESEKASLNAVIEKGVEVIYPDKSPFEESVKSQIESYRDKEEIYSLIKRIKAQQ